MQIVAFAILGLIFLIAGFILQFVLPELQIIGWGVMLVGVILLATSFIIEFRRVRSALVSRRGKFSASTTIMVSVFAGIILLVNAVSANFYKPFDYSGLTQFTLTSQTRDVLKNVTEPIDVLCFFVPNVPNVDSSYQNMYVTARSYAPALLKEYQNYTNKLNVIVIDPDQHPEEARKYGIANEYYYQSVIFQTKQGGILVSAPQIYSEAENAFTSAILQVTGIKQKTVYFLSGHGEGDPTDTTSAGFKDAYTVLRNNLFQVNSLDMASSPQIPEDCAVLVIAGPKTKMTDGEKQIIADYLKNYGSAVFLTNPDSPDDIAQLLEPWGMKVDTGIVIDPTSYVSPDKDTPLIDSTHNGFGMTTLYFPGATGLEMGTAPDGMDIKGEIITSSDAWMTDNYDATKAPEYDASKDIKGPFSIGALISPSQPSDSTKTALPGPRIYVIGDSDFATNNNFYNSDNGYLFTSLVSDLAGGKALVTIDRKVVQTRRLILTVEKSRFMNISSIALLPGLLLVIGVIVWWRRR